MWKKCLTRDITWLQLSQNSLLDALILPISNGIEQGADDRETTRWPLNITTSEELNTCNTH